MNYRLPIAALFCAAFLAAGAPALAAEKNAPTKGRAPASRADPELPEAWKNLPVVELFSGARPPNYTYHYPERTARDQLCEPGASGYWQISLDSSEYSGAAMGMDGPIELDGYLETHVLAFETRQQGGELRGFDVTLLADPLKAEQDRTGTRVSALSFRQEEKDGWTRWRIPLSRFSSNGFYWDPASRREQPARMNWPAFREFRLSTSPGQNEDLVLDVRNVRLEPASRELLLMAVRLQAYAREKPRSDDSAEGRVFFGAFVEGAPADPEPFEKFTAVAGRKPAMAVWFEDWSGPFPGQACRHARALGAIPQITWEPRDWSMAEPFTLDDILAGKKDDYVRRWAEAAAEYGGPLFVRPFHEFNGGWYPWSVPVNGRRPEKLAAAFRHVVEIFRKAKASNVKFIWCPNSMDLPGEAWNRFEDAYPGDAFVDWLAVDGYNFAGALPGTANLSFVEIYAEPYERLRRLAPAKPIMIPEFACAERNVDKARWIERMDADLIESFPAIRAIGWFNVDKEADWRIESGLASLRAFRKAVGSDRYLSGSNHLWKVATVDAPGSGEFEAIRKKSDEAAKRRKAEKAKVQRSTRRAGVFRLAPASKFDSGPASIVWENGPRGVQVWVAREKGILKIRAAGTGPIQGAGSQEPSELWNGDAYEIFLGPAASGEGSRTELSTRDFQLIFGFRGDSARLAVYRQGHLVDGLEPGTVTGSIRAWNARRTDSGWTAECELDLAGLFGDAASGEILFNQALDIGAGDRRQSQQWWSGAEGANLDPSAWVVLKAPDRP